MVKIIKKPDTNNNGQAKPTTPEQNGQLGAGVKPGTANPDQNTEVTTPNENGNPKPGTDQNLEMAKLVETLAEILVQTKILKLVETLDEILVKTKVVKLVETLATLIVITNKLLLTMRLKLQMVQKINLNYRKLD